MKPGLIIGITGCAGSGKTTLADFFSSAYFATPLSFADPIKAALNAAFGFTGEQWLDRNWKEQVDFELGISPRELMQTLGTDWGRNMICSDVWVKLLFSKWKSAGRPFAVVADIRFDNEARAILAEGGIVVNVERPEIEKVADHVSEDGISRELISVTVYNIGTVDELTRLGEAAIIARIE